MSRQVRETIEFIIVVTIMLITAWFFTSCSSHKERSVEASSALTLAQQKGERIYAKVTDNIYKSRCDTLTFKALLSVYSRVDLSSYETNGRWDRSDTPCYPESSRSSISYDGILSVLHYIVSTGDEPMLDRLIAYGEKTGWILGEGPDEYTHLGHIAPTVYNLKYTFFLTDYVTDLDLKELLSGFRGHLLASFIWLSLRTDGKVNQLELEALEQLVNASEVNPFYQALYHRVTDGDQREALDTLLNAAEFEEGGIYDRESVFGWGSAPASAYYLYVLSIIEGG